MQRKQWKQKLSGLMAGVLLLSTLPTAAFAWKAPTGASWSAATQDVAARFFVGSDTHIGRNGDATKKLDNALDVFEQVDSSADGILLVGDITDSGLERQYDTLMRTINASSMADNLVLAMGNHEYNSGDQTRFEEKTGQKANQVLYYGHDGLIENEEDISGDLVATVVKLSPNSIGGYTSSYDMLREALETSNEANPKAPVIVIGHHGIKNTAYVTNEWNGNYGEGTTKDMVALMKEYPQVIHISGHSHSTLEDARSIYQDEGFTAIQDGTIGAYFENESGKIDPSTGRNETCPPDDDIASQALRIDVKDDGTVTIYRMNLTTGAYMYEDEPWVFNAAEKKMPYTMDRENKSKAPSFKENAAVAAECKASTTATVKFPAAEPASGENVDMIHEYVITFTPDSGSPIVRRVFADYYMPVDKQKSEWSVKITDLRPETAYSVSVQAETSFGVRSQAIEAADTIYTGAAYVAPYPAETILDVNFARDAAGTDSRGHAKNVYGEPQFVKDNTLDRTVAVFDGKDDGLRYTMTGDDYKKIGTNFTVELYYMPLDTKNNNPMGNTQSSGFCFEQKSGTNTLQFWAHINGAYKKPEASVTKDAWNHMVATYDGENVQLYLNGELKSTVAADGTMKEPPHYLFLGGDTSSSGSLEYQANCKIALARVYTGTMTADDVKAAYEAAVEGTVTDPDEQAPGISFTTEPAATAELNEKYVLPTVNYQNDNSKNRQLVILDPDGVEQTITGALLTFAKEVPLKKAGTWTFTYTTANDAGQTASKGFTVKVVDPSVIDYPWTARTDAKIAVISDDHLYDTKALGTSGADFQAYLAGDRKMLVESEKILDAALAQIAESGADYLLISGDLTKDGEKVNHELLAKKLAAFENESGIQVFVINGNHDISNAHAVSFTEAGTVPADTVDTKMFKEIYKHCGYDLADAEDPKSLSYAADLGDDYRLIVMDACIYNNDMEAPEQHTGGKFSDETMAWVLNQIEAARREGRTPIGMMHHGLVPHTAIQPQFFPEYLVDDYANVSQTLADAGMSLVFTGHFHSQDAAYITTEAGNVLHDVETGSLVTDPSPIRYVALEGDQATYITAPIREVPGLTKNDLSVPGLFSGNGEVGKQFSAYAHSYLLTGLEGQVPMLLAAALMQQDSNITPEDAIAAAQQYAASKPFVDYGYDGTLAQFLAACMAYHYNGDEDADTSAMHQQLSALAAGLAQNGNKLYQLLGTAASALIHDTQTPGDTAAPLADNAASFALTPGEKLPDDDNDGGSGSGSSSSSSGYSVSVEKPAHGTVTTTPKRAEKGDTVTITVKPDAGYELDQLTVTDKNGDTIRVTSKGDGKYTFIMPSGKVSIETSFVNAEQPAVNPFADVKTSDYFYDAVLWAVEQGITSGASANTFAPNTTCTRAQTVTFLWRAAGSPAPKTGTMPFADVPANAYYRDAVLWAVEQGITSGTSAGTFNPDATVTRAQAATFLWRANDAQKVSAANPFGDVAGNAYYADAVLWAAQQGITSGTSATTFSPDASCTRAQLVTFLMRSMAE